ncbi:lipocalin-like domain-containing protein [uncultured Muribaculum sp.]
MKIEFPNGNVENLKLYGINGTAVDFRIRTLTSSKMTLQSDYAIIDFRKF